MFSIQYIMENIYNIHSIMYKYDFGKRFVTTLVLKRLKANDRANIIINTVNCKSQGHYYISCAAKIIKSRPKNGNFLKTRY